MRKILIIDDDMRYRDAMLAYLQSYGFEVSEAATVSAGLRHLSLAKFDILLVDGALPDGNGVDAIKTIRDSGNNVPIVFISGVYKDQATIDRLKNELAVSSIRTKPIVPDEICREIVEILRVNAKPKRPTFTFEKKDLPPQAKSSPNTDFSQYRPTTAKRFDTAERAYKLALPDELNLIRQKMEFAMHSPDQIDFDDLLLKVHNLKGTAAMYGQENLAPLMQRIEDYINLFLACNDSESKDSFEILVDELRNMASEI